MKLVKVKQEFFDLCEKNGLDEQLMKTKNGRPGVLIIQLTYKGKKQDFVVPMRSNIPRGVPASEYKSLPPNKNTKSGCHHGIHYIKLFPIRKKYIDKYNIDQSSYLLKVKAIIDRDTKEIVDACQNYLNSYEAGERHRFSPDIDGIIALLESLEQ